MSGLADWMNRKLIQSRIGGEKVFIRGEELLARFENDFLEVDTGAGAAFESRQPFLICMTEDVVRIGVFKDDVVEGLTNADGSAALYRVLRAEQDSSGMTRILLRS